MVDRKRIGLENHIATIRQDIHDNVLNNACSPANHALVDASSNDSDSNCGLLDTYDSN